jgi:hypothetical protein
VRDVTFSIVPPGQELAMVIEAEGFETPGNPVDYNIVDGSKSGHLCATTEWPPTFCRPLFRYDDELSVAS